MLFKDSKGFTLIEIVLAIALLGIIGGGMLSFFGNSARIVKSTDIRQKAVLIAQQKFEELKGEKFEDLSNGSKKYNQENSDLGLKGYPEYTLEWTISLKDEEDGNKLKKITIVNSWDNNSKSIKLTTYVTD